MSGPQTDRLVKLVRQALLVALVLFLGVVSAVFYARRDKSPEELAQDGASEAGALLDLVSAGEGFEHEVMEGDRKLFHIRAERILESRDSLFELENAFIEVTRENGRVYEVRADKALYQADDRDRGTSLEGNAIIRSSTGAQVRSSGFKVRRKGRIVSSTGRVRFRLGNRLNGTAGSLEAYLRKDRYQLSGDVRVRGGPEDPTFSLRCRRLIYEEENRRIYAEGDVRMSRRGQEISAGRITVTLAAESDEIRFVRARFNVSGAQTRDDDLESRQSFEGHDLSLQYDELTGEPRLVELDSREGQTVFLESSDASQIAQRLTAPRIVTQFEGGNPTRAEAFGGVEIREYLIFAPEVILTLGCSENATATFSERRGLESLTLDRRVDLHQTDVHAVGQRVVRQTRTDSTEIVGKPATVVTPRGELRAPSITHYGGGRRAEATGGVRAEMLRSSGFAMIREESAAEAPTRVTSKQASWDADSGTVEFTGDVRAWQGDDFIVADALSGKQGGDLLEARGRVRTVIKSRKVDDGDTSAEERSPVEVNAEEMLFDRSQRRLRCTGSPVARQAGRTVRCEDLELAFDSEDEVERMTCRDSVEIEDPTGGRSIRGDLAVYRPGDSLLEVEGRPAVLRDPEGNEVRGSVVVYDLESGVANVRAGMLPPVSAQDGAE